MPTYSQLKPEGYLPRLADEELESALATFGAVEICGPRWCGKSWTASSFAESVTFVDEDPDLYASDSSLALLGERPHLVDEWQDAPAIWNAARHAVDARAGTRGSFILTGSSIPLHSEHRHSGAGRIGRVRMRTMTLAETGESTCRVSLRDSSRVDSSRCASRLASPRWPEPSVGAAGRQSLRVGRWIPRGSSRTTSSFSST